MKNLTRFALVLLLAACGGDDNGSGGKTPVDPPVVIPPIITSGSPQVFDGALNEVLAVEPFVNVRDANGAAVANVWVKWTPTSGKTERDSSLTDSNGRASAGKWTLSTVAGTQTVTASARGASAVAMTVKVAPGPLSQLTTVSATITGVVGSTIATPVSIKAVDQFGNGVPNVLVQFSTFSGGGTLTGRTQTTDASGIATVGSWQLGTVAGTQIIRADETRTGANTLIRATATAAPASQFVVIDGNAQTGQSGKRLCTSPVIAVRDQYGNGIPQVPIVFTPGANSGTVVGGSATSNNAGVASVGSWTLSGNATQTLVVSSPSVAGVTQTITATVVPAPAFSVCARFVGDNITPRVRQAVSLAVQRWQRVIVGHTQSTALVEPANRCFTGIPAVDETVDDLLVFVRIAQLDGPGNTVARAGPCTVHFPSGLTQLGQLQLDSTDVDILESQGTLDNMVTHELGHVLGFGTLWSSSGRTLLSGSGGIDPFFTGTTARAQFAQLFSIYAGNAVPVENTGDVNSRDSHWRHSVFNTELMQGFSYSDMPMSRVTVGAMADIGYTVNLNNADPFQFPGTIRAATSRVADFGDDIAQNAVWAIDRSGRRTLLRAGNPLNR